WSGGRLQSGTADVPLFRPESLYVGIDVGKYTHVAGFVSATLLERHGHFEGCPAFAFEQSREGFRRLVERLQTYTKLEQVCVLLEKTGHYHLTLVQYLLDPDLAVYLIHVQRRPSGLLKTDKRDALALANQSLHTTRAGCAGQHQVAAGEAGRPTNGSRGAPTWLDPASL